jgi:putative tricarboxylic transport membrane protein
MTRRDGVAALLFLLLGVYVAWEGVALSPGTLHKPGPGFQPVVLGVVFVALALTYLTAAIPGWRTAGTPWPFSLWRRPLLGAAGILGYWLCLTVLGFVATTLLFLLYWLGMVEREPWRRIALVSVGTTAGLYLAFTWVLKIRLPAGILF